MIYFLGVTITITMISFVLEISIRLCGKVLEVQHTVCRTSVSNWGYSSFVWAVVGVLERQAEDIICIRDLHTVEKEEAHARYRSIEGGKESTDRP